MDLLNKATLIQYIQNHYPDDTLYRVSGCDTSVNLETGETHRTMAFETVKADQEARDAASMVNLEELLEQLPEMSKGFSLAAKGTKVQNIVSDMTRINGIIELYAKTIMNSSQKAFSGDRDAVKRVVNTSVLMEQVRPISETTMWAWQQYRDKWRLILACFGIIEPRSWTVEKNLMDLVLEGDAEDEAVQGS